MDASRTKKKANEADSYAGRIEPIKAGALLAEAALLFGWEPQRVLKMRAALFFRVLNEGRAMHAKAQAGFVAELCNVASITYNDKNYKTFSEHYRERAYGKRKIRALDLKDDKTAHILSSAFWASSPIRRQ